MNLHCTLHFTSIISNHLLKVNHLYHHLRVFSCVCLGLEGVSKGEKMSVRVWGNPAPFALGTSLVSWETIALGGTFHMSMCDVYSVSLCRTGHEESNSWADIV